MSLERANWLRHFAAYGPLGRVAIALEGRGIPFVLVKGIITAHILYGNPALRPISDIDVRIPRRDFPRAVCLARKLGWYERPDVSLWQALWKVDGWEIDVKSALGPPGLCAVTVDDVIRRAERAVEPFGVRHLRPELNDHALILVINAFKDGLRATPWAIEDLRRIVHHERFDPDVLVERARAGHVASALWTTADWLAEQCGAVEWRSVRDRIGARPPSRRSARVHELWRKWGAPPKPGLFVIASSSDNLGKSAWGLALAAAGVVSGRALRVLHRQRSTPIRG